MLNLLCEVATEPRHGGSDLTTRKVEFKNGGKRFSKMGPHVFVTNNVVEGGCFYDGRKMTVLETRDKQSFAYNITDVESSTFYISVVVDTTLFITYSTMVVL